MVFNFMSDGIPIVYYGQEQAFRGPGDPVSYLRHDRSNARLIALAVQS